MYQWCNACSEQLFKHKLSMFYMFILQAPQAGDRTIRTQTIRPRKLKKPNLTFKPWANCPWANSPITPQELRFKNGAAFLAIKEGGLESLSQSRPRCRFSVSCFASARRDASNCLRQDVDSAFICI